MNILGFDFLIIDGHLEIIKPSLRNKIKIDLEENGRYHTASIIVDKETSRESEIIVNRLIKEYKFPDKDYYNLIEKHGSIWVKRLLIAKKWNSKEADKYINKLNFKFKGI